MWGTALELRGRRAEFTCYRQFGKRKKTEDGEGGTAGAVCLRGGQSLNPIVVGRTWSPRPLHKARHS